MSQNARLEILRRVVVLKVVSKKRNFLARKNSIAKNNQKPFVLILQPSSPNGTIGLACLSRSLPSWLDS
jgi:hypothetical protein